ncbi:hypothetical protein EC900039_3842B, partial [Escherichia coli 90.0039]
NDSMSHYIINI